METLTSKQNSQSPCVKITFSDLPPEIVEKIFIYSCHPDIEKSRECIKTLSLVSRKWLQMTNTPTIHRKYFRVCLKKDDIKNSPEEIFRNSIRNFYNFNIKRINFSDDLIKKKFLKLLELDNLSKLETLSICRCSLDYDLFCNMIEKLKKLKELKIEECRFPKEFLKTEENCQKISKIISQLVRFEYVDNIDQGNLKFLNDFVNHTKHLKYFKVEENTVYDEQTLYTSELSTIIYKLIENNRKSLKNLNFFITCDSHSKFLSRYDLKPLNLELDSLTFINIPVTMNLNEILLSNLYLSELELIFAYNNDEELFDFTVIAENLKFIKVMKIAWVSLKNFNLFTLNQLKKLQKIILKGCIFDFRTINQIQQNKNLESIEITDTSTFFDDLTFDQFTENLLNLDTFIIRQQEVSSDHIQTIIKNLITLKILCIEECEISEYAVSGFNEETQIQDGISIENLKNLEKLIISAKLLTDSTIVKNFKFPNLKMLHLIDEDIIELTVTEIICNCPILGRLVVSIKFDEQKCNNDLNKIGKYIEYDNEESYLENHKYNIRKC